MIIFLFIFCEKGFATQKIMLYIMDRTFLPDTQIGQTHFWGGGGGRQENSTYLLLHLLDVDKVLLACDLLLSINFGGASWQLFES
jgi:hypothetical protein